MSELEPKIALAMQRSHEDAKAANALFQAAGQSAILINGGASTAILTFAASTKATLGFQRSVLDGHPLAGALICFAAGVIAGAFVIGFQAKSVQFYAVRWQNMVLEKSEARIEEAKSKGYFWGRLAQQAFAFSMGCFLLGAAVLAFSLV